jgi:hypothetical protein
MLIANQLASTYSMLLTAFASWMIQASLASLVVYFLLMLLVSVVSVQRYVRSVVRVEFYKVMR